MNKLERLKLLIGYREAVLDSKIAAMESVHPDVERERLVAKREELKYVSDLVTGLENENYD